MQGGFKRVSAAAESFDLCDLLMNAGSNQGFTENGQKWSLICETNHLLPLLCVCGSESVCDTLITIREWKSCLEWSSWEGGVFLKVKEQYCLSAKQGNRQREAAKSREKDDHVRYNSILKKNIADSTSFVTYQHKIAHKCEGWEFFFFKDNYQR